MNQKQNLPGTAILRFTGIMLVGFGLLNLITQLINVGSLNMAVVGMVPIFGAGIVFGIVGSVMEAISGGYAISWAYRADRGFRLIIFGIVTLVVMLLGNLFVFIGLSQLNAPSSSPAMLIMGILWPILLIVGGAQNRKPPVPQTPQEKEDQIKKNLKIIRIMFAVAGIFILILAIISFVGGEIVSGIFSLVLIGIFAILYFIFSKRVGKNSVIEIAGIRNTDAEKILRAVVRDSGEDWSIGRYQEHRIKLTLVPEPDNPDDPNAIKVVSEYETPPGEKISRSGLIGYIPKEVAAGVKLSGPKRINAIAREGFGNFSVRINLRDISDGTNTKTLKNVEFMSGENTEVVETTDLSGGANTEAQKNAEYFEEQNAKAEKHRVKKSKKLRKTLHKKLEQDGIGSLINDESVIKEARLYRRMYGEDACISYLNGRAKELGMTDVEITEGDLDKLLGHEQD